MNFDKIMKILEKEYEKLDSPVVTLIAETHKNPFMVLISTLISLRTRDEVTIEVCRDLFEILKEPIDYKKLTIEELENIIKKCGFYRNKARTIYDICKTLVEEYDSIVPNDIDELLKFKGVGRKTANLVLSEGYNLPGMCVDVHVHRISNRLGVLKSKTPDETELILRKILPIDYWNNYNTYLVAYGQKICRPISPHCSNCKLKDICKRVGVKTSR